MFSKMKNRISSMASRFDLSVLQSASFVRSVELFDSLPSTNDHAKGQEVAFDQLPRLIVAEKQTAGRGRGSNSWCSDEESLTFSLMFSLREQGIPPELLPMLSITAALTVCDAIHHIAETRATIKWPNDIYLGDKKCAGILIESPRPDEVIIGVGLNLGSSPIEEAIALADVSEKETIEPEALLVGFLDCLEERLDQLGQEDLELAVDWNERSFLTDKRLTITQGEKELLGICIGLGNRGELLLELEGAEEEEPLAIVSGSVTSID